MYVKISPEIIEKVKQRAGHESHRGIAMEFGISPTTVFRVVNGIYDTGRLRDKREAPKDGYFNVDEISKDGKTWLV